MKKTLICVDNLDNYICGESHKLYVDGTQILTAGAKDELTKRGIGIVYCSAAEAGHASSCHAPSTKPEACPSSSEHTACADMERLVLGIAAILKKECGISDPEELKTLSLQAVKTIKENM